MSLIEEMRQSPGLPIRCRWVEGFGRNRHDPAAWDAGGWGLHGCGPVIGTTQDVRDALAAGLLRRVSGPANPSPGWKIEWDEYMLAK